MPNISELYFWEDELHPHKIPLVNAFVRRMDVGKVTYVCQRSLNSKRISEGVPGDWLPNCPVAQPKCAEEVSDFVSMSSVDSVHIFSGMHWVPNIVAGIKEASLQNRFFGIMSEPRVLEGIRGVVRFLHSWTHERHHRRHARFVAGIGRHGPGWFKLTGYGKRVFPFAYFIDPPELSVASKADCHEIRSDRLRVGYIGRLNYLKGFDTFLRMIELKHEGMEFVIAGQGPMTSAAKEVADRFENVQFLGVIPMSDVPSVMAGLDCLIVPSRTKDDGWAVVVSETLFCGTMPIIGGRVGASVLADGESIGRRVDSDDPKAYLDAVKAAAATNALSDESRKLRMRFANNHLSADAGAEHLMRQIIHVRDGAPRPAEFYA